MSSNFVIITGLSGAGKSEAVKVCEDMGYFCVDNLPPVLIPKFSDLVAHSQGKVNKVALVCDVRGGDFFNDMTAALEELETVGFAYTILYLEATEESLIRRFKFTRRRHPLSGEGGISEGIFQEKKRLEQIRGKAHKIIDTTELTTKELRVKLQQFLDFQDKHQLDITIIAFGFKHGLPLDVDLVFDCRFLPNPHYVDSLRPLTGNDSAVYEYVFKWPIAKQFWEKLQDMMEFLLPQFVKEGKTQLIVGIGCTGGQHRSVAMANRLANSLTEKGYLAKVEYRDIKSR